MVFRKILDALSLRAVRQRLDRRKLQEELDLHRLFLLTAYRSRHAQGTLDIADEEAAAQQLDTEARELGPEGTRAAVSSFLQHQIVDICRTLHTVLEDPIINDAVAAAHILARAQAVQPNAAETPIPRSGLGLGMAAAAARSTPFSPSPSPSASTLPPIAAPIPRLSRHQVADLFLRQAGFALHTAPSSVEHKESGDGLWLRGSAAVGQVVALYPGVAYPPLYHREIPGYPLVSQSNPFLLARFDGVVMDAKPWGHGRGASSSPWPEKSAPSNPAEDELENLEGRHPLALAHIANHPPQGTQPNVVVAAVNWTTPPLQSFLRAYFPVVEYGKASPQYAGQGSVAGVALVALRALHDEELFLNYRLNPNAPGGLPGWYSPVDGAEDERRWA